MKPSAQPRQGQGAEDEPCLIRKYSSRRLYDVAAGRFVTLDDLYKLIRRGRRIKAVDSAGKDITRSILLQILTEREESGRPMLSPEVLHEMVRLYGDATQGLFESFLQEGLAALLSQQETWRSGVQDAMKQGTTAAMGKLFEQQLGLWKASQELFLGAASGDVGKPKPGKRRK